MIFLVHFTSTLPSSRTSASPKFSEPCLPQTPMMQTGATPSTGGQPPQQGRGGGVGVEPPVAHGPAELIEDLRLLVAEPAAQLPQRQRLDLPLRPAEPPQPDPTGALLVRPEAVHGREQLLDPGAVARHGGEHRRLPGTYRVLGERDHRAQVPDEGLGALPVRLVDDEDVADLQDAGLR